MWKLIAATLLTAGLMGDAANELQAQEKKPQPHGGYYKILPDGKVEPSQPKSKETWAIPKVEPVPGISMSQAQKDRFNHMAKKFPIHRAEKDPNAYTMQYRLTPDFRSNANEPSWEPRLPRRIQIPDATQIAPILPKEKRSQYYRMLPKAPRNRRP